MKKTLILSAVMLSPVLTFAQTTATTTAPTINTACINTAVDKRDNTLLSAHDVFNTSIKNAITNRGAGIKAAWALTDKNARQTKKEETRKSFKTAIQTAHDAKKNAKKTAWSTYQTDMKACGVTKIDKQENVRFPSTSI